MASALVIKSWTVSAEPFESGSTYVLITGRNGGVVSWFLSLVGIDPSTTIRVTSEKVEFTMASLAGIDHRLIPLQHVCSTYYGYHKPWKFMVAIIFLALLIGLPVIYDSVTSDQSNGGGLGLVGLIIIGAGIVIGLVSYFLSRTLTLGFVETSGIINGIRFKRSVIENIDINQDQARSVCELTEALISLKQKSYHSSQ